MEERNEEFVWKGWNRNCVFPIDFSATTFAEGYAKNGSTYPVKRITDQSWFQDFQSELSLLGGEKVPSGAAATMPLEALPLLIQLINQAEEERYKQLFSSQKGKTNTIDKNKDAEEGEDTDKSRDTGIWESFLQELFLSMHNEVMAGNFCDGFSAEEHEFYANTLYENPDFSRHITASLWDTLVRQRLDLLIGLAKGVAPEIQMGVLIGCINALDWGIRCLQEAPDRIMQNQEAGNNEEVLIRLMRDLTAERKRDPQQEQAYLVDNTSFRSPDGRTQCMEDAFENLNGRRSRGELKIKDEALRQCSREVYLKNLSKKFVGPKSQSQFLAVCRSLHHYMGEFKRDIREETLLKEVKTRMAQYLKIVVNRMEYDPGKELEQPRESFAKLGYSSSIIDRWIAEYTKRILSLCEPVCLLVVICRGKEVGNTIALETILKAVKEDTFGKNFSELAKPTYQFPATDRKKIEEETRQFYDVFYNMWCITYKDAAEKAILKERDLDLKPEQITQLSSILSRDYCRAAPIFGLPTDYRMAKEYEMELRYCKDAACAESNEKYIKGGFISFLLETIIVIFLHKEIELEAPRLVTSFLKLRELYCE